jgi:hypothetical protein
VTYWTIVHVAAARSIKGQEEYRRIAGKILLFATYRAACEFRKAKGWSNWNDLVTDIEVDDFRLRKECALVGAQPQ